MRKILGIRQKQVGRYLENYSTVVKHSSFISDCCPFFTLLNKNVQLFMQNLNKYLYVMKLCWVCSQKQYVFEKFTCFSNYATGKSARWKFQHYIFFFRAEVFFYGPVTIMKADEGVVFAEEDCVPHFIFYVTFLKKIPWTFT